jgi:uncharacterized cupredoxin-like copper-binding protein
MRAVSILTLIAALALLTTACGAARLAAAEKSAAATREITVTATEMSFSPAAIEVPAGQPVKLTFRNNGMVEHNWQGQVDGETILVTARPRQSGSKTFTPRTPGTYKIICSVPGHEQAGMVATLTVR